MIVYLWVIAPYWSNDLDRHSIVFVPTLSVMYCVPRELYCHQSHCVQSNQPASSPVCVTTYAIRVVSYGTSVNVYVYTSGSHAGVNDTPDVWIARSENSPPRRTLTVYAVDTLPSTWVTTIVFTPRTNGTDDSTPDTNDPDDDPDDHDADPVENPTVNPVDDNDPSTGVPMN